MIISTPSATLSLQLLLQLSGSDPGPLDGIKGPKTTLALKEFQAKHPLMPSMVGSYDITTGIEAYLLASTANLNGVGVKAVVRGFKEIGYYESPPGSNMTKFGVWYGRNGVPWCNIFVSYCLMVGGEYELCSGFKGSGVRKGKGCAYVPTTQKWLSTKQLTTDPKSPAAGDIAIYGWDLKTPAHIGFACGPADAKGNFPSLEGNTSPGSDSNGGMVLLRTRNVKSVLTLGRLV
jgi:peptidoglycan hydrolase-like protein with peptidoglycan-binding domain